MLNTFVGEYLQIDLMKLTEVTAIATQVNLFSPVCFEAIKMK